MNMDKFKLITKYAFDRAMTDTDPKDSADYWNPPTEAPTEAAQRSIYSMC